jgi:gluconolactonase
MVAVSDISTFCDGLDHPECVTVHPDGSLWAGGEAGQIYRISPDGSFEEVANTGGFILGLAFDPSGSTLIACDLRKKCLWAIDAHTYEVSLFSHGPEDGAPFSIPNHLVFSRDGSLFVTDSGAFREVTGRIIRYAPGASSGSVWHEGPFNFANGIALAPDEHAVYLVCSWLPGVERVELRPDGTAGRREVFVTVPETVPDGLAFDEQGDLYISCYTPARIYRAAPDGTIRTFIDDWEAHTLANPTNIVFGGQDLDRLYVANLGRWHIAEIPMPVRGAPLACLARR